MRSMLVIGLGRFGKSLAIKLTELGNEVLVIDSDESLINDIEPHVTRAQIGDCMDAGVIDSLGVKSFDICFVCISENFQSSLEITSLLKDAGAKYVISKADRDIHAKFLLKIGADEVIYPERDMARKTAMKCSAKNAFDYIELTPEYAIFEVSPPESWKGRTIRELNIRSQYHVNIIGIKTGTAVVPVTDPEYRFIGNEHLIIAGGARNVAELMNKN